MGGDLRLRPVGLGDEAAALAAHRDMEADGFGFLLNYDSGMSWPDYVQRLSCDARGIDLPPEFVPHTFLLADVRGVVVGRTSIRHELNEYLAVAGGHIGYGVLAAHRRRGYATETLRQSLVIARAVGVDPVLVTCDVDNVGSARVIEACGGVFESVVDDPRDGTPKRRYWIS